MNTKPLKKITDEELEDLASLFDNYDEKESLWDEDDIQQDISDDNPDDLEGVL